MSKYKQGDTLVCRANLVDPLPLMPDRLFVIGIEHVYGPGGMDTNYVCRVTSASGRAGNVCDFDETEVAPFAEYVALYQMMKDDPGKLVDRFVDAIKGTAQDHGK